jgi:hypothetical protein
MQTADPGHEQYRRARVAYARQLAASAQPQEPPALRDATGAPFLRLVPTANL